MSIILTPKPLVLLDFSNLIFRYYYGLNDQKSLSGIPTHAISGWFKLLNQLKSEFSGSQIVCVYDNPSKHRLKIYPEYKKNRPPKPISIKIQMQILTKINDLLGLPTLNCNNHEADDLIASACKLRQENELVSFIFSNDKDLCQMVTDNIFQIRIVKNNSGTNWTLLDKEGVSSLFNLNPNQIVDYLCLLGDIADNITGVRGIGPKTASMLLQQYNSLDNLLDNVKSIPPHLKDTLSSHFKVLSNNKKLISLKTDIDINLYLHNPTSNLTSLEELLKSLDLHAESVMISKFENGVF